MWIRELVGVFGAEAGNLPFDMPVDIMGKEVEMVAEFGVEAGRFYVAGIDKELDTIPFGDIWKNGILEWFLKIDEESKAFRLPPHVEMKEGGLTRHPGSGGEAEILMLDLLLPPFMLEGLNGRSQLKEGKRG